MSDPIDVALAEGRTTLTEFEGKRLLADAGIDVPDHRIAADVDAAVDAADEIGYPVVVKVSSPGVIHKNEWGNGDGVSVGLTSPSEVRTTATAIQDAAQKERIDASILVESVAPIDRGTEMIVGCLRDASFGPTVLVGLGGVFTEVYEDIAHRLAPIGEAEATEAIGELTAVRLLEGFRGRPAADTAALAEVVVAVGNLVVEREEIAELDVNPVLATPNGAIALDAFVRLGE